MKFTRDEFLGAFETGHITIEDIADRMLKLEAKVERYEEALKKIVTECNEHDWMWRVAKEALGEKE